jgi:mono/diheme cytochrome c family protein
MNPDYQPSDRLVELIDSLHLKEKLSTSEAAELELILLSDVGALEFYLRQQELHTMLGADKAVRLQLAMDLLPKNVIPMPGVEVLAVKASPQSKKPALVKASIKPGSVFRAATAVAAMVAALAVLLFMYSKVDEITLKASQKMNQLANHQPRQVSFHDAVLPILTDNCFECHGENEEVRKGDLRLDQGPRMLEVKLEKPKTLIIPGAPDKSELIARISSKDPEFVMPPPKTQHALSQEQIAIISLWVAQGAVFDTEWSAFEVKKIKDEL